MMPTFADLAGIENELPNDGISIYPLITGKASQQKEHDHEILKSKTMKTKIFLLSFLCLLNLQININAQKKVCLAVNPPMGWNSWDWFGKQEINEQIVREVIDAIVNEGLAEAGYNYVIVDGGWRDTQLGPNGQLLAHPVKFPNGIKPLADYAHSKGLKFGVHTVPGTHDCGGDSVGGFNREEIHIKQFVDWGLDFVKVDLCRQTDDPCLGCEKNKGGWSEQTIKDTYLKWSRLLNNCGRDIFFSISAYKYRDWYPAYCNMARSTGDIKARIHKGGAYFNSPKRVNKGFLSVMAIAEFNNQSADAAGNGFWNDPDMMVIGEQGLSPEEQISHFALWCLMTSPLMLGNDPRSMTQVEKELILNREMIAINQDPFEQGKLIKNTDGVQIWLKNLSNGNRVILLLNLDEKGKRDISLNLKEIGVNGSINVRDVIHHQDLGIFDKEITQTADTNQCWLLLLSE